MKGVTSLLSDWVVDTLRNGWPVNFGISGRLTLEWVANKFRNRWSISPEYAFDITVFDAERNEVKSIRRMSGGERTWIEDAITKAICIYNKGQSNRIFLTIFTDEKDGALDIEKKKEFFAMKRRVLGIGGYEREFCITQTPELQELADARILLSEKQVLISS